MPWRRRKKNWSGQVNCPFIAHRLLTGTIHYTAQKQWHSSRSFHPNTIEFVIGLSWPHLTSPGSSHYKAVTHEPKLMSQFSVFSSIGAVTYLGTIFWINFECISIFFIILTTTPPAEDTLHRDYYDLVPIVHYSSPVISKYYSFQELPRNRIVFTSYIEDTELSSSLPT